MDMTSNGDISSNMANTGDLGDDDAWGSDFDESIEEIYSQEIEDNKINENLEVQLRNASNINPTIGSEELRQTIPATTESANRNTPTACTGAIPKKGCSYLVNNSFIPQNNLVNHALFQRTERRYKNIEGLNKNKSETIVFLSTSPAKPPNEVEVKSDTKKIQFGTKNSPGKLKPDAFNFLNRIPAKIYKNDKDVTEERKHLVPTAFIHAGNLHHSQLKIEYPINHDNESDSSEPSAPLYPDSDLDNYESIGEDNRNENEQIGKPALPSRPPPIFKHLSGMVLKPNAPLTKLKPNANNLVRLNISPDVKDDTICKEKNVPANVRTGKKSRTPRPPDLISRPLPPVPVSDQPNLVFQPKSFPTSPVSLELISNPLPLVPISDESNLIFKPKSYPTSPLHPELISRTPPQVPISDQSDLPSNVLGTAITQSGTSDESSCDELSASPLQVATSSALYPNDPIFEINKLTPAPRSAIQDQTLNEITIVQPRKSQQILAQIISSQSQVSSAVLKSQQRISTEIASKSNRQNNTASATNNESTEHSLQNIRDVTDDGDYLQSSVRSSSTDIQKPKVPQRKISNPLIKDNPFNFQNHLGKNSSYMDSTLNSSLSLLSNSPTRENTDPPPYPNIEALHSSISRPSLPQKLKTTQRSVSCSSLVQSFRDMSFAMWNPPPKDKRISAGSPSFDRATKEFTKEKIEKFRPKGFSVSNAEIPKEVTVSKPMKSMSDYSSTEKNSISLNAWYHDVDAREAQRRLLNFIDQNGAFLIRPSTRKTYEIQHTACIVFSGRIINMHIRRKSNGQFALGTGKEGEPTFPSISDLIKYHQDVPIESSGRSSSVKSFRARLRVTPPKL